MTGFTADRCGYVNPESGEVCRNPPLREASDNRCLFHSEDPLAADLRQKGRSKGGRRAAFNARDADPLTLDDFEQIMHGVREVVSALREEAATPAAAGQLLRAYELAARLQEDIKITRRLDVIEGLRNADQD